MDEIVGYIDRITFQNGDSGFTVAWIKLPKMREPICIVGNMAALSPGETVRCKGKWTHHLVHGRQFAVESYEPEHPADIIGIKKYLGSGLVKGIGPRYAERIVERFGMDTLRVIDHTPGALAEVEGIGKKRIDLIKSCWNEQKSIRDVMIFLQSIGVSPTFSQKIYKAYGDTSIEVIKSNPYRLANDLRGIGFKKADQVAANMGIEKNAPIRIESGLLYVMEELAGDGHTCYPEGELQNVAREMLGVDEIEEAILRLCAADTLRKAEIEGEKFVWNTGHFIHEVGIAKELKRINTGESHLRKVDTEKALVWVQEQLRITLAPNQAKAVEKSLEKKAHIITGGPGTGKSTITNCILKITEKLTGRIALAAPTGRAAKRMTEITGRKATTLHSLLEVDFKTGGFKRDAGNPLECDLLIVDEASMIDTTLMYALLRAIPTGCRLLLVGDIHQLPSVGPGNVLKDIIDSKQIPITRLTEIFRQAKGSKIVTNAHRINAGIFPDIETDPNGDFFFIEMEEPEGVLGSILDLVSSRLPKKYGFDPIADIQVLTPMKKGVIGMENLNVALQEKLNPKGVPLFRAGRKYQIGDKVMQIRNQHQKGVYNGDIGIVHHIDPVGQIVTVTIDDRHFEYDFADLDELVLAYAVSIHKSQGSEYPCVVIPVHTSHFMMLHRNILYTGLTRGKKVVVFVGTKKALAIGVKNDEVKKRFTGLQEAIWGKLCRI